MAVYVSDLFTATPAPVDANPTATRTFQWLRGSTAISGATSSTYTAVTADIGSSLSTTQFETNFLSSVTATSASTEVVQAFDPIRLFSSSEPGVWYDPNDAANLLWRRNLLTYSEQFDNAAWVKSNATITANSSVAPDGTTTADTLIPTTSSGIMYAQVANAPNQTFSVYVKAAGFNWVALGTNTLDGERAYFNLSSGTLGSLGISLASSSIQSVGNGWYRCSFTTKAPIVGTATGAVWAVNGDAPYACTPSGSNGILLWGAQLETGSVATEYQPITDLNTEVIARFPNATLYQDVTGSIPVTTPGQTVALMLDKSRGLTLGPEVILNGNFSAGLTSWDNGAATIGTLVGSAVFIQRNDSLTINSGISQSTAVAGKRYLVEFDILSGTGLLFVNDLVNVNATAGRKRFIFTAVGSGSFSARCYDGGSATIDNISVKELPGLHATQPTLASRPTYGIVPTGGRRNLLTFSEQFDDASWVKLQTTVTANATTAPDGTMTADRLLETVTTNSFAIAQSITGLSPAGKTYTVSTYAKKDARDYVTLGITDVSSGSLYAVAVFNLNLGTVSTSGSAGTGYSVVGSPSISSVGDGWYRCVVTVVAGSSASFLRASIAVSSNGTISAGAGGFQVYLGSSTSGIFIWGDQLELGSTATAYQRVSTDYDVTEAGIPSLGYLFFDGVNDWMVTPTITPGTDKVQVFAGVRKLADVTGVIVEGGANADSANGILLATHSSGSFLAQAFGSSVGYYFSTVIPAPTTKVLTSLMDISGASLAVEIIPRVNGTVEQTGGFGALGTGDFVARQLYIGRRNGSTAPLNGHLFPLIVRFGPNLTTARIAATETWVATKTAGVTL